MKFRATLQPSHPSRGEAMVNNFEADSERDAVANSIEWARAIQNLKKHRHVIGNVYKLQSHGDEDFRIFSFDFTDWKQIALHPS